MVKLTKTDIERISELSKIDVKKDEKEFVAADLNGIFSWIDALESVDVSQVECFNDRQIGKLSAERNDDLETVPGCELIIKNAPDSAHGMFAVPKVVE